MMDRMVVDANVIVSAVLGRSLPLLIEAWDHGVEMLVPAHQYREALLVARREGGKRGQVVDLPLEEIAALVVVVDPVLYRRSETDARARLTAAGQKDWPLVALAVVLQDAVWSNDVDLFGTGIAVWNTHNVGRAWRRAGANLDGDHA